MSKPFRARLHLVLAVLAVLAAGCNGLGPLALAGGQQTDAAVPTVAVVFLPKSPLAGPAPQATFDAFSSARHVVLSSSAGALFGSPTATPGPILAAPNATGSSLLDSAKAIAALNGDLPGPAIPTGRSPRGLPTAAASVLRSSAAAVVAVPPGSPTAATKAPLLSPSATVLRATPAAGAIASRRRPPHQPVVPPRTAAATIPVPLAAAAALPTPALANIPVTTNHAANQMTEVSVYDDELNSDWSAEHSVGMTYSLTDPEHAHAGQVGAAIMPQQDLGRFFLTVRQDAKQTYTLDRVFGVTLWVNSGSEPLDPSSLAVTVVGSNDYPYWVPDDHSVELDDKHFFSESRLYYLGINRPIPPNTWVEIDVWLDKLPYAPDYKYITGIYIKNDQGFRRTFYIDQVQLLLAG